MADNVDPNPTDRGAEEERIQLGEVGALENQLTNFGDKNTFSEFFKLLKYPNDINDNQDHIKIQQIEYKPAPITGVSNIRDTITNLSNREASLNPTTKEEIKGTVYLPIPNDLSETNQTGWGEDSLSAIAASFMGSATGLAENAAEGNLQGVKQGALDAIKNLGDDAVTARFKQALVANAGASLLKFAGINVNPEAYITRVTGAAINPNLELLFNGPKLRQFGFTFKLVPRSQEEAKNIRGIIKFFKKGMAPRRTQTSGKSIFLGTPNVFRVTFMSGNNELKSIGKMKTCALVSCAVNYTPDGFYAAFEDARANGSQPIAVVLSLGFTELTPIYNDEYDAESKVDNVGPDNIDKYDAQINSDGTRGSNPDDATGLAISQQNLNPEQRVRLLEQQRRFRERTQGTPNPINPSNIIP